MPVITLKDGTQGYQYPTKSKAYQPTKTPHLGARIRVPYETRTAIVIREAPNYGVRPTERDPSGWYWIAYIDEDGSIGPMTTTYLSAKDLPTHPNDC